MDKLNSQGMLCGHQEFEPIRQGSKLICQTCRSFADMAAGGTITYGAEYAAHRGHADKDVGSLKVASLEDWLKKLNIDLSEKIVCEVGFGGAFTLSFLNRHAKEAYGIEVSSFHLEQAKDLGVPWERLMLFEHLDGMTDWRVDLWLFLDSFEHLPNPAGFMSWLNQNSSASSSLLIVAPEANSLSDRVLGSWWPHRVADHLFHWSKAGLKEFLKCYGYDGTEDFYPRKRVSLSMVGNHLLHHWGRHSPELTRWGSWPSVWFNIGEMGLLFARSDD